MVKLYGENVMVDRYCRRNPFTILVLAMLTLCAIIVVTFHSTVHNNISTNSLTITFNSEVMMKPITASKVRHRKTVILLQQSPVLPMKQLNRLNNIDITWANWTTSLVLRNNVQHISVTAAVPYDTISNINWSNIRPITMFPLHTDETKSPSPFHNMIRSLLTILSGQSSVSTVDWIVMGNDHTFIFPMNLQAFLNRLDSNLLIYSGNELRISYKKRILSFASGGAGAVLSHTTAKLIVAMCLAVTEDTLLLSLLPSISTDHSMNNSTYVVPLLDWDANPTYTTSMHAHCTTAGLRHLASCDSAGVHILDMQHSGSHIVCMLSFLRAWLYDHSQDTTGAFLQKLLPVECRESVFPLSSLQLKLIFSKHITLIFRKNTSTTTSTSKSPKDSAFTVELIDSRSTNSSNLSAISVLQLRKECSAPDKWTKTNPGIVLANCLSAGFQVPFTASTSTDIHRLPGQKQTSPQVVSSLRGERFNVYGTLRTILNEFDDWYYDCKRSIEEFTSSSTVRTISPTVRTMSPVVRDVISFHYISEMEAQLLYELLSPLPGGEAVSRTVQPLCSSSLVSNTQGYTVRKDHSTSQVSSRTDHNCSTVTDLRRLWPRSGSGMQAGPYARAVAEGVEGEKEVTALYSYLSQIILN